MDTGSKFARLLDDYERLAVDEGAALREVNLTALAKVQSQKTAICQAVLMTAAETHAYPPADQFQRVLQKLKDNLVLTQKQLARLACEQQNLSATGQRLNHVGRAYRQELAGAASLQAQG